MEKINQEVLFTKEELTLLYEASASIHAIRDFDGMLKSILGKIKTVFRTEGASIALHDADRKEFYFIRTLEEERNGKHAGMKEMRFSDHLGVAGWVLRENRPVLIQDTSKDDRFFKGIDLQESFVTKSMICLPLRTRKGLIGVIYALNKLEGEFTARETRLLEILSGTIAISIENARLYGELKDHASSLEQENLRLKSQVQNRFNLQGIIGSGPAMRRVFALLDKVIDTTTSVLIQGETGTGKELIARAVHYNGCLKEKPFVAENCGALSENLLESELFGHVKGAFTGAITNKKGLFELAHGGTIFLDEISEMPVAMQVKLLRVLQEGQVRRVGGTQYINVDVRLIASTNRDLEEEAKKGNFREDLFYRVNVFPITLPPLRERREDISLLAAHFLKKLTKKQKRPSARLTPRALNLLSQYDWPGNVRELQNEIQRAMTLAGRDKEIREKFLSEKINASSRSRISIQETECTLQEVTQQIEQQMVVEALEKTGGNRSQAARILGLTRQGLLNKIARYQIEL
ncbi:MAG: sigma 54-interacting transcriptional regulator [Desulfobacteraceae bacterium]|nr:sigma 54-interacting transcriptional regulator [Desulfobacteraceae bacterium]MBC2718623.1 sigma 54-interacting transcriptional regulator [Desulfobacteraceae bacterium]